MPRYRILLLICLLVWLPSCDEDGEAVPFLASCDTADQNRFVHEVMLDKYLWYEELDTDINYDDFDSPQQLLDFLRFDEKDRFSYIADAAEFNSLFSAGQYLGYGFSYLVEANDTVWIRFVYNDSPAGRAGLVRGDEILSINGESVEQIIQANDWANVFGPAEQGVPLELLVRKADTSVTTLDLFKDTVNINTVLKP